MFEITAAPLQMMIRLQVTTNQTDTFQGVGVPMHTFTYLFKSFNGHISQTAPELEGAYRQSLIKKFTPLTRWC